MNSKLVDWGNKKLINPIFLFKILTYSITIDDHVIFSKAKLNILLLKKFFYVINNCKMEYTLKLRKF